MNKLLESKIQHLFTCIAFQDNIDIDLIKNVKDAFEDYVKTNNSENIQKLILESDNRIMPKREFSFIKTNQLKLACAALLNIASIFYKVPYYCSDIIIELLNMMIDEPTRASIDEILTELNHMRFSHEVAIYLENVIKILDMNNDEFVTANMEDFGFNIDL